ncbi:MAG: phosphoribosylanthranilate isomerase [Gemmatimonadales bacterium]
MSSDRSGSIPAAQRADGLPQLKICCIASPEEAALAVRHGATALGVVSAMPSGPGVVSPATISAVLGAVPPGIDTFLLTSRQSATGLVAHHREHPATTLQLVDHVPVHDLVALRAARQGVTLVQVIHVTGPEALDAARAVAPFVDALLLDSGNPAAAVRELGGTGRAHDWAISARIREAVDLPVWLAGGLHAGNVARAVEVVRPHGVDVCSGVRTEGRLDPGKLAAFASALGRGGGSAAAATSR